MNKRTVLKIESAVNKINSGNYGTEDLELLLTNLRFYVGHETFTRELGDFINHSEGKTKGTLHDAISYMFYRMLFFTNYQMEDSPALSEDTIFPYYFKKLLTLALKRKPIYENVNSKLGISRDQAYNIFKKLLPDNFQGKLNKDFCTSKNLTLVSECIGLLAPGSEIDAEEIVRDFVKSIDSLKHKIGVTIDAETLNKDKLVLHVLDILNAKDFVIDKKIVGHCKLHLERSEIRQADLESLDDQEFEIRNKWSTFGIIQLSGVVKVDDQKDLSVIFPLITSEIDSMAVIDDSLISKTMDSQGKEILKLTIPEVFTISEESKIVDYY